MINLCDLWVFAFAFWKNYENLGPSGLSLSLSSYQLFDSGMVSIIYIANPVVIIIVFHFLRINWCLGFQLYSLFIYLFIFFAGFVCMDTLSWYKFWFDLVHD